MKLSSLFVASLISFSLVATPRAAEAGDGDKILVIADKRMDAFQDQSYSATMEITKGGSLYKTLTFDMTMKGLDKQLIHFTSPGDVAGMKVLMADQDTIWTYSPEFKKVRKIAAHMQKQGFLGSHFRAEDMTLTKFAARFDATMAGRSGKQTTLSLTPKAGVTTTFSRLDIVIDATKGGVTKITYFEGDTATREQRREGWKKIGGKPMPTQVVMVDLKSGDKTTIKLSNIKVNQGVDDGYFSKRTLLRG
jgi:outer membrane lipoprotein-sorting protein